MSESERIIKTIEYAGRSLLFETGFLAQQADGSVLVRCGDTVVLATVVTSEPKEDMGYFPLVVDYEEKLYAGGIIKGSRWNKREGRPSDQAILNARLIDRSIRPLFPKDFKNEVQVIVTVLSVDDENDPAILGILATSAAIRVSGIPWKGPIGAMRVGLINDELVLNPEVKLMQLSDLDLVVTARQDQVVMVEMGGNEIPYAKILDGIQAAQDGISSILQAIDTFSAEAQEKLGVSYQVGHEQELTPDEQKEIEIIGEVEEYVKNRFPEELLDQEHQTRSELEEEFLSELFEEFGGKVAKSKMADKYDQVAREKIRAKTLETKSRVDGRKADEVRPITVEVGLLPRAHGSAMFKRGDTQVLTIATLGSTSLEQLIESMRGEETKRYIHHYNFPPYSTGEVGRVGSPKRREIGHGALAERALMSVIPNEESFPYTIRLVSEVLSSNGSTSMASTCGSTLALMDAGVPISEPVSGIAMGLISENGEHMILSDIQGVEDFYGDMDFKVAGTKNGITALQMDVKIPGLTREILEQALKQAEEGRMHIMEKMLAVISDPRENLSKYAPKIQTIRINPKKIGELIGPGGKVIRALQESTETEIDVQEDGTVHVAGVNDEGVKRAVEQIDLITKEVAVGEKYSGKVTRVLDFGAFVQILPGQEGMVHISELTPGFVKNIHDHVKEGDEMEVKVIGIDDSGRINLSRKAVMGSDRGQDNQKQQGQDRGRHDRRRLPDHKDRAY